MGILGINRKFSSAVSAQVISHKRQQKDDPSWHREWSFGQFCKSFAPFVLPQLTTMDFLEIASEASLRASNASITCEVVQTRLYKWRRI